MVCVVRQIAEVKRGVTPREQYEVGLLHTCRIQLTHSLRAPGFNPGTYNVNKTVSEFAISNFA
jgi:hypothetical protein